MEVSFKLEGADKLVDRLSTLPSRLQQSAGKRAARRAMAPVRAAARAGARPLDDPETAGNIARNVYLQQSRRGSKRIGGVMMRLGILGGANLGMSRPAGGVIPGGDTRHWRMLELGTERIAATPFLVPALEQNAEKVAQSLVSELSAELDRLTRAP